MARSARVGSPQPFLMVKVASVSDVWTLPGLLRLLADSEMFHLHTAESMETKNPSAEHEMRSLFCAGPGR
jgi:hypothetical protein